MSINDRNWKFLHDNTGLSLTYNNMYYRYLKGLGFTGTLQQMIAESRRGLNPVPDSGNPTSSDVGVVSFASTVIDFDSITFTWDLT